MKLFIIFIAVILCLLLLYLLAIMPGMRRKPQQEQFKKVLYAHRGLYDNKGAAPENSMAAFRRAVEGGYGIELDVQLTADNVAVVFHDFTLNRMCKAEGKVKDYTYGELQRFTLASSGEKIPKFEEVLKLVAGKVPLIVELKMEGTDTSVCKEADGLLQKYQGLYCIESFHPLGVYWYRKNRPEVIRGQLSDGFFRERRTGKLPAPACFVMEMLLLNFLTKPDFVAYNHKYAGNLSRRLCHGLYRNTAVAYTIKSEEQLQNAGRHFDIYIFDSFIPQNRNRI